MSFQPIEGFAPPRVDAYAAATSDVGSPFSPTHTLVLYLTQIIANHDPALAQSFAMQFEGSDAASTLEEGLARLPPTDQENFSRLVGSHWQSLKSLEQESDPDLFLHGLAHLARRWQTGENPEWSFYAWRRLSDTSTIPGLTPQPELQHEAEHALALFRGEGSFFEQAVLTGSGIIRQNVDFWSLMGFGAAALGSSLVRYRVLRGLLNGPTVNFFTRGTGAYLTAATAAWATEVPIFWGISTGARELFNPTEHLQDVSHASLSFLSTAVSFGLLRLGSGLTRGLINSAYGVQPITGRVVAQDAWTDLSLRVWEHAGMVGALYVDQALQSYWGWRPDLENSDRLGYAISSWFHLMVGNEIAGGFLGPNFRKGLEALESRTQAVIHSSGGPGSYPPMESGTWGELWNPAPAGASGSPDFAAHVVMTEGVGGRPPRRFSRAELSVLANHPERILNEADQLTPRQLQQLTKETYENGQWLRWILHVEGEGPIHLRETGNEEGERPSTEAALERLARLETEFADFHAKYAGILNGRPIKDLWQRWTKESIPEDSDAFGHLMVVARRLGIQDFFQGAFTLRHAMVELRGRIRFNDDALNYYSDLYLIRHFLKSKGMVSNGNGQDGLLLSDVLLRGQGNCVTLSLLFSHLAARIKRPVRFGLLPNHLFLLTSQGGALEATHHFGLFPRSAYDARVMEGERNGFDSHLMSAFHLVNLGKISSSGGRANLAERILSLSQRILPNNPRPLHELLPIYEARGDLPRQLEVNRDLLRLMPSEARRLRVEALDALVAEKDAEAQGFLEQLNRLNGEDLVVLRLLRDVYRRRGRNRDAERIDDVLDLMEP